jgi:hypothetical protein
VKLYSHPGNDLTERFDDLGNGLLVKLRDVWALSYRRGQVTIRDRSGLEEVLQ